MGEIGQFNRANCRFSYWAGGWNIMFRIGKFVSNKLCAEFNRCRMVVYMSLN